MKYRAAASSDRKAITALHVSVSQSTYRGILPDSYLDGIMPTEKAEVWQSRLSNENQSNPICVVVAEQDGLISGFVCFVFDQECDYGTYLHNLYVDSRYRKMGMASRLIFSGIDRFEKSKLEVPVNLLVFRENKNAIEFYERLGGRIIQSFDRHKPGWPPIGLHRFQWQTARALREATISKRSPTPSA